MTNRHQLSTVAVDSCIIVDLLTGVDPTLVRSAQWILDEHHKGHKVLLPAIVIPEIAGCGAINGDMGGVAARDERVSIVQRWIRDSEYLVADLTERIARQGAQLSGTLVAWLWARSPVMS